MKSKFGAWLLLICFIAVFFAAPATAQVPQTVYVIPVKETIEPGLAKFMERNYLEAEKMRADLVLLEVDTPGGRIDAALQIRDLIKKSPIPTAALVQGGAISAGALITLASSKIAMVPGSTIGDAEPRTGSERADEKIVSYWAKEMAATAEMNKRDPKVAVAMADRDAGYPNLVEKGKLLTLTYLEAQKVGYTDFIVRDRNEFLAQLGFADARVIEAQASVAERLTRLVTNPFVAPFLLMIGIAGVLIEVFTVGWGIAGLLGIMSLTLYFGGHLLAGFTGWESILLFLVGAILLAVEAFVPGFGIPGISGIICIAVSIVLAAPSWEVGVISLVLSLTGTIILVLLSFKFLAKRKFLQRLVLGFKPAKETGYVPQSTDWGQYLGQVGEAFTILRPAGTMVLKDGTRLDVVTAGDFIKKGEKVEVIQVEGGRIIVRAIPQEGK